MKEEGEKDSFRTGVPAGCMGLRLETSLPLKTCPPSSRSHIIETWIVSVSQLDQEPLKGTYTPVPPPDPLHQ